MSDEQAAEPTGAPDPSDPLARMPRGVRRFAAFLDRLSYELIIVLLALLFFLIIFLGFIVHNVPAGHVGVLWSRFGGGTRVDVVLGEGLHLTLPWDEIYTYDRRLQQETETFDVLTDDGLTVTVEVAWRYRLIGGAAALLHQYVGPDYASVLVKPDVLQRTRDILSVHRSSDLYSAGRLRVQSEIRQAVEGNLRTKFNPPEYPNVNAIALEDVMIRDVKLPDALKAAIVRKNEAFERAQEYTYRIEAERKEAERRRIEALGIRSFQEIVNSNLSEGYLRWRGIEATTALAKSPNSKIVVIGSGAGGLPLILNPDGAPATSGGPR